MIALGLLLALAPLGGTEPGDLRVLRVDRVLTLDGERQVFQPGQVVTRDGRIESVGPPTEVPAGAELVERDGWAIPGYVDLHSHVVAAQVFRDLNDMVLPLNPELSTAPAIVPSNRLIQVACASGVTTLFLIPGSGTSISGFGVFLKTKTDATWEEAVLADPGGMKVAQAYNPERRSGDLGLTRAGLYWLLEHENRRAQQVRDRGVQSPSDLRVRDLARVHAGELPVLIHTAGSDGVGSTVRMWGEQYDVRSVLSHGSFDGYLLADYAARVGIPVNHGPRTFDAYFRDHFQQPTAKIYHDAGGPNFSLNTDAPVIPAEELFLQGTTTARQGVDGYSVLEALTINPARAIGIDDRVGSLEVGKDADVVVFSGNPLDPRSRVELVWIDGETQYDRASDGQLF